MWSLKGGVSGCSGACADCGAYSCHLTSSHRCLDVPVTQRFLHFARVFAVFQCSRESLTGQCAMLLLLTWCRDVESMVMTTK